MKQEKAHHKKKGQTEPLKRKSAAVHSPVRNDFFNAFLEKKSFLVTLILLTVLSLFVFRDFIFCNKLMLYKDIGCDSLNASYPILRHTADYIHTTGFPKWSFNVGMGQNIFPFCLRDPFDIIIYILGKDALAYGLGYLEFIKVILSGIVFFLYLRTFSFTPFSCMIGSLLYAFNGFIILGSGWYIFSFEALNSALLLLAFEKLFRKDLWALFPVAIAFIGISQPFNLYVYGMFIAVYAIFRYLDEKEWQAKSFFVMFSKLTLLGLLGIAISSFFLFSNILQLIESPRGSGSTSYFSQLFSTPVFVFGNSIHNLTAILRFYSNDIMGVGSNFKGWNNYLEAPLFYCGLISLLLFPLVFQYLNKRRKIIYSILLCFWILPVIFPFFRYSFWLFTGDYYRAFSFFVSFTVLFYGINALNKIQQASKIRMLPVMITTVILFVILSFCASEVSDINKNIINKGIMFFAEVMMILYALLIMLLGMPGTK